MIRYARPRLITADDKRYRAYVDQFILQRSNQKAMRPPRQRDIFGGQAERALRGWLAQRLELCERRILEYEEHRGRRADTKYRELDALLLDETAKSVHVFEIKASRSAGSLRRASGQLYETRNILRLHYPTVALTVLLVDTGIPDAAAVAEIMAGPDPPARPPETLAELLASRPDMQLLADLSAQPDVADGIGVLRFSVDDIVQLAGAENLALDWSDEDEDIAGSEKPASSRVYSSNDAQADDNDDDDDDDNPMAAALRRAGLS
jgi:hypothetical protein